MDHTNVVTIWARWLARTSTTVLATTHCLPSVEARQGSRLREKLVPYALQSSLRFADGIVAVSTGAANDLAKTARIARERITVIHNPVLTPEFFRKLKEPVSPSDLPVDRPLIISVGRLVASKDFPSLIRAFAKVRKEVPSCLLILGEGEERPALERLIADSNLNDDVLLPGYTSNPYVRMAHAKVFVLSSAYEAFGNVLVESLAAGTPVIATDCPTGPREILKDGKFGELVAVGDTEALAKAIVKVLRSGGPIPPPHYLEKFQLESVVDAYISAMETAARHACTSCEEVKSAGVV
jgi:glycosyltransferase involved in cell wall biosynthesis